MRRYVTMCLAAGLLGLAGCSSDDSPSGPTPPTTVRVQATATASAPSLASVNDVLWNTVPATGIDLSTLKAPKPAPGKIAAVADSIFVQAITHNDSLYLRLRWADPSHDFLHNHYEVIQQAGGSQTVNFTYFGDFLKEDHLIVLFGGLSGGGWDAWHWRSLTTAYAFLAEDQTFVGGALIPDTNNSTVLPARANEGLLGTQQPTYVHKDGPLFTDTVLYWDDRTSSTSFVNDARWQLGQIIPGWLIDTSVVNKSATERLSRWDIRAASAYSAEGNQYTVVMCRPMFTGFKDDVNLAALDSAQVEIGVMDNLDDISRSGSQRGFSEAFWLIF